jgi:hypothetical protein
VNKLSAISFQLGLRVVLKIGCLPGGKLHRAAIEADSGSLKADSLQGAI